MIKLIHFSLPPPAGAMVLPFLRPVLPRAQSLNLLLLLVLRSRLDVLLVLLVVPLLLPVFHALHGSTYSLSLVPPALLW